MHNPVRWQDPTGWWAEDNNLKEPLESGSSSTGAILVLDFTFNPDGLPLFGHTALLFQDGRGIWWLTEITHSDFIRSFDNLHAPSNGNHMSGTVALFIPGDFSSSYAIARGFYNTTFGNYNLPINNCVHHTLAIMRASSSNLDPSLARDINRGLFPMVAPIPLWDRLVRNDMTSILTTSPQFIDRGNIIIKW